MKGVFGKASFCQLPVVVAINKELQVLDQGLQSSSETTRLASQSFEIMPEIRVDGFDGIGLLFVSTHFVGSAIVECVIDWKGVRIVMFGLRSAFQASLQGFCSSFENHIPTQDTAGVSIYNGEDIDFVFFLPTKVNNSSSSACFTFSGKGAFGN